MNRKRSPLRIVGLCVKPSSEPAAEAARVLAAWLEQRGITLWADPEAARVLGREPRDRESLAEKADLLVVLGGDGTLLSAVRAVGARPVPIVGVNLGTLGFLAEVAPGEQFEALERVLAGDYRTVARMRLDVRACRGTRELFRAQALNDAVIARSELSRMMDLEAFADGDPIATYHADGLIVATPTGSTAYTLSAGGPILMPEANVFVLTPICPHALSQRPLVLPPEMAIEVHVGPREGRAQLTVDGQLGTDLEPGDRVIVSASAHPAHFVISPFHSRFDVLRSKLGWGRA